jgi:hypothetical protein
VGPAAVLKRRKKKNLTERAVVVGAVAGLVAEVESGGPGHEA